MNGQGNNGMNNNQGYNPNNNPNNNQNYNPNNYSGGVIRSKNVNGGYESLDDSYTKEDMEKDKQRRAAINYDLNKMNSELTVSTNAMPEDEDDFLSKAKKKAKELKDKGMELFNKLRGDSQTNLSSSELRKMELQNKMIGKQEQVNQMPQSNNVPQNNVQQNNVPQNNVQQNRPPMSQQQMRPNGQQVNNGQPMMNNQTGNGMPPVPPVAPIPSGSLPPQPKSMRMKKKIFEGLPNGQQQPKKGLFGNFFHKNQNVDQNGQVVEPWMLNQPLSAQSLGVSQNEIKKEVIIYDDSGKYFNASADVDRVSEDNSLHTENFAKPMFQKKVKPNKELERKKNGTLLRSYFGRNYDTISMGVFSIAGLLFGGLRFITYKMFLLGFAAWGAQLFILCFVPWRSGIMLYFGLGLILAFISNPIIMGYANAKIKIYRMTHSKWVEEQLNAYVSSKSKTYGGLAFLIFLLSIAGTAYLYFAKDYEFKGMIGNGYDFVKGIIVSNASSEPVTIQYDNEANVNVDFTYTMPSEFVLSDNVYNYYISNEEYDYCSFSFRKVTNYNEASSLLQAVRKITNSAGKIDSELVNDVLFSNYNYTDKTGKYYYLSIKVKDNLYLIKYYSGSKTPQNVCDNYYVDIKNSIKKVETKVE
jgi:hypothetical protein